MKTALHDLLGMHRLRSRWLLLACAGAGLVLWAMTTNRENNKERGDVIRATDHASAGLPSDRPVYRERPPREPELQVDELVAGWVESASSADRDTPVQSGIFVSSRPSPMRKEAFRRLLAGMRHDNAEDLYDLLDRCPPPEPHALSDEEWSAFLEKWGRLDGAGAAGHLENLATAAHQMPEMVRGWAAVDPDEVEIWLRDLPYHPWKAAAVTVFAATTARWDPSRALDWALSVQGPWRSTALHSLEASWPAAASEDDRAALEAAVSKVHQSQLPATEDSSGFDLLRPQSGSGEETGSLESLGIYLVD